ncbi:hypothetical protein ACWDFL_30765 [Streptomyces bungoensis]
MASLEPGSPPHADPTGRRKFVDDAARRLGADRFPGPWAGMVVQEAGERALGQRDLLRDGEGDDG